MKISAIYGNGLNNNVSTLRFRTDLFTVTTQQTTNALDEYLFQEEVCCCHKNDKSWHWYDRKQVNCLCYCIARAYEQRVQDCTHIPRLTDIRFIGQL